MPSKCKFEKDGVKCTKNASYGPIGTTKRIRCKEHAGPDMAYARKDNRSCIHPEHIDGRATRASFNFPDEKKPLYCKSHSLEGMINLNNKNNMCKGCGLKQPSYGIEGKKASHCSKCATDDMIDVISRRCKHPSCRKNPTYGKPGGTHEYCQKHALPGMIDVKNKRCKLCKKQPTYGVDYPTHCKEHKTNDMSDMRHGTERCKKCSKRATYSLTSYPPTHCTEHKTDDMKDIVSVMCAKCGEIQGRYGNTRKTVYCVSCKDKDMKNVKARMCEDCGEHQPTFNYKGVKPPRFCAACKLDDMVDVINPMCKSCGLFVIPKKPHLCSYCKPKSTIRQKTREMLVVNHLEENGIKFTHNKSVGYVCGNYRPDVLIDADTHFVIVEIDEDQHRQYDPSCETARMYNIYQAQGMKCVFLRYNPDVFHVEGKAKKVQKPKRLAALLREVVRHMNNEPEEQISVFRLFYNNDTGEYVVPYELKLPKHLVSASTK